MTDSPSVDTGILDNKLILALHVEPVVVIRKALTIVRDGIEVGSVDAVYDFSAVPPALHELALRVLRSGTDKLILPTTWAENAANNVSIQPVKRSFWQTFKDTFYG